MLGDEEIDDVFPDRKVSSVVFCMVLKGVVCRLVVDDVWVEEGVCWKMIVALVEVVDNNDWEAANGELQTFRTMFFVLVLERFADNCSAHFSFILMGISSQPVTYQSTFIKDSY